MEEVLTEQDFEEWKAFGKKEIVGKLTSRARAAENVWRWANKRWHVRRGRWAFGGRWWEGGTGRSRELCGEILECQGEGNGPEQDWVLSPTAQSRGQHQERPWGLQWVFADCCPRMHLQPTISHVFTLSYTLTLSSVHTHILQCSYSLVVLWLPEASFAKVRSCGLPGHAVSGTGSPGCREQHPRESREPGPWPSAGGTITPGSKEETFLVPEPSTWVLGTRRVDLPRMCHGLPAWLLRSSREVVGLLDKSSAFRGSTGFPSGSTASSVKFLTSSWSQCFHL